MHTRALLSAAALLVAALAGCDREAQQVNAQQGPEQVAPAGPTERALAEWRSLAQGSRAEIERKLQARLDELHDAVEHWHSAALAEAKDVDGVVAKLREDESALRAQLDALQRSTEANWHELCAETQTQGAKFAEQCRRLFEQR